MGNALKILITNNSFGSRAGSELYVRDIAPALAGQGHEVSVYSNLLGEVAEEIYSLGIPVLSDLSKVPFKPDIIHGQHHLETMTALLHFPDVPVVYLCHGFAPWEELPPIHPRIMEYAAVDEPTRRHCIKHGVPTEKIRLILNFVDTDRFKPRGPLPSVPKRALLFDNYSGGGDFLPAAAAAFLKVGIQLDARGLYFGMLERTPEAILGSYDIVFAKARSAMEAMAVGAAVVISSGDGVGPMVCGARFDHLRLRNFGRTTIDVPPSVEALIERISHYNADDAAGVSARIRSEASLEATLPSIVEMYRDAIEQWSKTIPDPRKESLAMAGYVRRMSDFIKAERLNGWYDHNWFNPAQPPLDLPDRMRGESLGRRVRNFLRKLIRTSRRDRGD